MAFDAIWTLAMTLNYTEELRIRNNTQEIINKTDCHDLRGELVPLNEFQYTNAFMGCVIKHYLHETKFVGVTVSTN